MSVAAEFKEDADSLQTQILSEGMAAECTHVWIEIQNIFSFSKYKMGILQLYFIL